MQKITIENAYGFIYITTNNINGKKYIGKKIFDKSGKWKSYYGSGIALKDAIKKYGKNNFSREIIYISRSKEDLNHAEIEIIAFLNAVDSKDYYNISKGGDGFSPSQKCRAVYCIELEMAFKNSSIAEEITNENKHTIFNKCQNYHNHKRNIKTGYHWCYIEDIYTTSLNKSCVNARPVICLRTKKIYASLHQANIQNKTNFTRKSVLTDKQFEKYIQKNIDVDDRYMYLFDYLQIFNYTKQQ